MAKLTPKDFRKEPTLPLLLEGETMTVGWDIPTRWAVDSDKRCWMDNAHGHKLDTCKVTELLKEVNYAQSKEVCQLFDFDPPKPPWYAEAIAEGWTPPKGKVYGFVQK